MNFPEELRLSFLNGQCADGDIRVGVRVGGVRWQGVNTPGCVLFTHPSTSNTETLNYMILLHLIKVISDHLLKITV